MITAYPARAFSFFFFHWLNLLFTPISPIRCIFPGFIIDRFGASCFWRGSFLANVSFPWVA